MTGKHLAYEAYEIDIAGGGRQGQGVYGLRERDGREIVVYVSEER